MPQPLDPARAGTAMRPDPARRAEEGEAATSSGATRERLLDAAERLFAARGFEGTSMRALAELAGTSISAAHYHFGGKAALMREVLLRRIEPINAARLSRLETLCAACAPEPPDLESVLEAFLRPSFESWLEADAHGAPALPHILAQLQADHHEQLGDLKVELHRPMMERFIEVLVPILPDKTPDEILVGMQLVVGVLMQVVGGQVKGPAPATPEGYAVRKDEAIFLRMLGFATAGLRSKEPPLSLDTVPAANRLEAPAAPEAE